MSQYFPKPYRSFKGNVKTELDLSSYGSKADGLIKECQGELMLLN